MRLTNYMRDAYIRAVMQDVPVVNNSETVSDLIRRDSIYRLPEEVQSLGRDADLSKYLNQRAYWVNGIGSVMVFCPSTDPQYTPSPAVQVKAEKLAQAQSEDASKREALRRKLHGVVYACTTRKALHDALPEFRKYLPAEATSTSSNLPAVTNVASEFINAGWPKQRGQ
jgi:hypothetical protein